MKHLGTSLQRHTWLVMRKQIVLQGRWLRRHWIFKRAKVYWDSGLHGQRIFDSKSYHWAGPMRLPTLLQPVKMLRLMSRSYNIDHTRHLHHYDPATIQSHVVPSASLMPANTAIATLPIGQIPSPLGFLIQDISIELSLKLMAFLPLSHECWDHAWLHKTSSWTPYLIPTPRRRNVEKASENLVTPASVMGAIDLSGLIEQGVLS